MLSRRLSVLALGAGVLAACAAPDPTPIPYSAPVAFKVARVSSDQRGTDLTALSFNNATPVATCMSQQATSLTLTSPGGANLVGSLALARDGKVYLVTTFPTQAYAVGTFDPIKPAQLQPEQAVNVTWAPGISLAQSGLLLTGLFAPVAHVCLIGLAAATAPQPVASAPLYRFGPNPCRDQPGTCVDTSTPQPDAPASDAAATAAG